MASFQNHRIFLPLIVAITLALLSACNGDRTGGQAETKLISNDSLISFDPISSEHALVSENAIKNNQAVASGSGTITFQNIGAPGWYPSVRDPASLSCDAYKSGSCCMTKHELGNDSLSPWNEELIMTLRGPIRIKQFAVYQPSGSTQMPWNLTSIWDEKTPTTSSGIAFKNEATPTVFQGVIGNKCLIDVSTNRVFPCGPGSVPYCQAGDVAKYFGWEGSKLIIIQASMPHVGSAMIDNGAHCSLDKADNWYDAPWIGLSHGELIRAGKFGGCQCYAKDPSKWQLADGCGQFNVFEVVNDNNTYQNFDLFSTNFFAYHGYVGDGPCGQKCAVTGLDPKVDLVDRSTSKEALAGGIANPQKGPGTIFRRPTESYRYFVMLLDVSSRTVQLGIIDTLTVPSVIPTSVKSMFANLPSQIPRATISELLNLRLPAGRPLSIINH
jgi:hypothetical protein